MKPHKDDTMTHRAQVIGARMADGFEPPSASLIPPFGPPNDCDRLGVATNAVAWALHASDGRDRHTNPAGVPLVYATQDEVENAERVARHVLAQLDEHVHDVIVDGLSRHDARVQSNP